MMSLGIFFFTEHYYHWGLRQNFLLAAGQGAMYVLGSLAADRIARRLGRRRGLIAIYAALAAQGLLAALAPSPAWTIGILLAWVFSIALTWPSLESLVSSGADAHAMSRRVGMYNLVWSGTNVAAFAVSGTIIEHWRVGVFVIPAVMHASCALLMWRSVAIDPPAPGPANGEAHAHVEPEPQLLASRTLAMWLARISLPATYVVVYGLSAMMPLLPVMRPLDTSEQTFAGSIWMLARFAAFVSLGMTIWWHTRPRILLAAAAVMLVAFIGVTVRPSEVFGDSIAYRVDLASMIGWQIALGAVMGVIYSASLYFGMVLSDGSTEHGGYHEALIGLGSVVGPGTAALTQLVWPGDVRAGVAAVCGVIGVSVVAALIANVKASSRGPGFQLCDR
jgi:MFS family permease